MFEILESLIFYYIEPAKTNFMHFLPRISREILDSDIWVNPSIKILVKEDKDFIQLFNVLVCLLHDLQDEIPENLLSSTLLKLHKIGLFDLINEYFLYKSVPCDFDVLGYYLKIISLYHLHLPKILPFDQYVKYIQKVFSMILNKKLICNNVRRYLSNYGNETLKNLADEMISIFNVHPQVAPFLIESLDLLKRTMDEIENYLSLLLIKNNSFEEMAEYFMKDNPTKDKMKELMWFEGEEITPEFMFDNFYIYQKHSLNLWKFYGQFFDHLKSNIYEKIFEAQSLKAFDMLFERNIVFYSQMSKIKKFAHSFMRNIVITNNNKAIGKFTKYAEDKIVQKCENIQKIMKKLSQEEKHNLSDLLNIDENDFHFNLKLENISQNVHDFLNEFTKFF